MAWKSVWKGANVNEALPVPEKTEGGLEKKTKKDLQPCGAGRKSRKRPTPVVGQKPYGKSQFKCKSRKIHFVKNVQIEKEKKRLATLWSRKKITKKAHAGRGPETIWEIPV